MDASRARWGAVPEMPHLWERPPPEDGAPAARSLAASASMGGALGHAGERGAAAPRFRRRLSVPPLDIQGMGEGAGGVDTGGRSCRVALLATPRPLRLDPYRPLSPSFDPRYPPPPPPPSPYRAPYCSLHLLSPSLDTKCAPPCPVRRLARRRRAPRAGRRLRARAPARDAPAPACRRLNILHEMQRIYEKGSRLVRTARSPGGGQGRCGPAPAPPHAAALFLVNRVVTAPTDTRLPAPAQRRAPRLTPRAPGTAHRSARTTLPRRSRRRRGGAERA